MPDAITSQQNPKIKQAVKLRDAKARRASGLTIIEGKREIGLAADSGLAFDSFFYCSELAGKNKLPGNINKECIFETTVPVFKKISYRENPDGWLAIARVPNTSLDAIRLSSLPLVIILEAVEKPGNLGAILRSADAAGADAVIIADPRTDIYNPNSIRSSQGTIFTKQIAAAGSAEIADWLKKNKIKIFSTTPDTEHLYTGADFKVPTAIVMGTEDRGLGRFWLDSADEKIKIKMDGRIDSLNVSVSTAIILFEAIRQRNRK
jgi:RNA methyltransferase, TrmH family